MAELDVTELLYDPDFVDPVILIHRTATVDAFGENVLVETSFNTVGSVQATSGRDMQRLPELLRLANVSTFWIKAEIVTDGFMSKYPDIIVFRYARYQVQQVLNWENFGNGWTQGLCVVEKPIQ